MKKLLLSILIVSILAGCKTGENESQNVIDSATLDAYFQKSDLPAAIMGYCTQDGQMEWKAFGPSIWGETDTINENNIFRIFSMTKAIASVAVLQLVEQDLIDLDEPLDELMPEMTSIPILSKNGELIAAKKAITLRSLLTHTAGFGYNFSDQRLQEFDRTGWEYEDLPRLFESGEQWNYGTNLDWVGKIIEKISGQDLETYLRKNVTGPLKMNSTWFNVPEELKENIVSWGARDSTSFQEYPRIPNKPVSSFSAGGGLFGSAKDYLTFLKCILNDGKYDGGQLLKPETVESLFKNQLPIGLNIEHNIPKDGLPNTEQYSDEADTYGLAWAIENNKNELLRSKGSGYWSGIANSYYSIDPKKGVAIVYFTQFFPFKDKETYDFYRLFEKEVYSSLK